MKKQSIQIPVGTIITTILLITIFILGLILMEIILGPSFIITKEVCEEELFNVGAVGGGLNYTQVKKISEDYPEKYFKCNWYDPSLKNNDRNSFKKGLVRIKDYEEYKKFLFDCYEYEIKTICHKEEVKELSSENRNQEYIKACSKYKIGNYTIVMD